MVEIVGGLVDGGIYRVYTEDSFRHIAKLLAKDIRKAIAPLEGNNQEKAFLDTVEKKFGELSRDCVGLVVVFGDGRVVAIEDSAQFVDALEKVGLLDLI